MHIDSVCTYACDMHMYVYTQSHYTVYGTAHALAYRQYTP